MPRAQRFLSPLSGISLEWAESEGGTRLRQSAGDREFRVTEMTVRRCILLRRKKLQRCGFEFDRIARLLPY
jgi:hypothetical protein